MRIASSRAALSGLAFDGLAFQELFFSASLALRFEEPFPSPFRGQPRERFGRIGFRWFAL
jgi:hypothetical protein